jgi:DNA-binding transcriptional ArsR family regulator
MIGDSDSATLKTTALSIEVVELIEEMGEARVSEIADRLDRPKSTVHGHLATLEQAEFVVKRGDLYYLGPELLRLGNEVRTRKEGYVLAREFTERMYEQTGLRSNFSVEMGGKAVFIHSASGNKMGWAHERMGNRLYLHSTAVGKAILSELRRQRVAAIVDRWTCRRRRTGRSPTGRPYSKNSQRSGSAATRSTTRRTSRTCTPSALASETTLATSSVTSESRAPSTPSPGRNASAKWPKSSSNSSTSMYWNCRRRGERRTGSFEINDHYIIGAKFTVIWL